MKTNRSMLALVLACASPISGMAEEASTEALAKAAQNPIASMINVPIQSNIDFDWGPDGDTFAVTKPTAGIAL